MNRALSFRNGYGPRGRTRPIYTNLRSERYNTPVSRIPPERSQVVPFVAEEAYQLPYSFDGSLVFVNILDREGYGFGRKKFLIKFPKGAMLLDRKHSYV